MTSTNELRVPAFCPICERVMKGSRSVNTYYSFGCCRDCWVEWIDPDREERWLSGWRPSKEQIDNFCERLSKFL